MDQEAGDGLIPLQTAFFCLLMLATGNQWLRSSANFFPTNADQIRSAPFGTIYNGHARNLKPIEVLSENSPLCAKAVKFREKPP